MTDPDSRPAFREALADIAAKAKDKLPALTGRIEKAVGLVLSGDVFLQTDGSAMVGSQSDPTIMHKVAKGECDCKDFRQAQAGLCKHRLAVAMFKKATEATESLAPVSESFSPLPAPLPEAPVSITAKGFKAGQELMITIRGYDFEAVKPQVEAAIQWLDAREQVTLPAKAAPPEAPPLHICAVHGVPMKERTKNNDVWFSHKTPDGWCRQDSPKPG